MANGTKCYDKNGDVVNCNDITGTNAAQQAINYAKHLAKKLKEKKTEKKTEKKKDWKKAIVHKKPFKHGGSFRNQHD